MKVGVAYKKTGTAQEDPEMRIEATHMKPFDHGRKFKSSCFETLRKTASRMREEGGTAGRN